MHECPDCGAACGCPGVEDHCEHDCDGGAFDYDEDEVEDDDEDD